MNLSKLPMILATLFGWSISTMSQAHYLWVTRDPSAPAVTVSFEETAGQGPLPLGDKQASVRAWTCAGRVLGLKTAKGGMETKTDSPCVGATLDYGVVDRQTEGRGVFWLKYYAKGATTFAASQENLQLPVELTASERSDGTPVVTVLRDGKPAEGAEVVVEDSGGGTAFDGMTGANGTAVLPQTHGGPLQVRALITDHTPGVHGGKPYDLVRSYSTLTVTATDVKPLMRLLRESFGDMHDVVSNTAFINTVMASKLTMPQLVDHLQQRAIINQACDRVLRRYRGDLVPYGPQQRQVLDLLRENLRAIGARWPSESQAWPETKALLKEIDDSAKEGPYFALGVFHVYYGGVTHGGRDIGALIDQQLKTNLTYYEKTDGYDAYALKVDEIVDPKAEQQMVQGADEAYRYIIAVNNLNVFKAAAGNR